MTNAIVTERNIRAAGGAWERLFTTERGNWLKSSGMGHTAWAYESFNNLPRSIQVAFAEHLKITASIYAYR